MGRKMIPWGAVILSLVLAGCTSPGQAAAELGKLNAAAPDALAGMLGELENRRILFIGESHPIVNEELFIAENIGALYDAGVRYLFDESGIPDYRAIGGEGYQFYMFYPWMSAGWRYEGAAYYQAVRNLNALLPETERIQIIAPESDSEDYAAIGPENWMNYRDSYAAKTIMAVMDAAGPGEKALIHYGSAHGVKELRQRFGVRYKPLGAWLAEKYGDAFASYRFYLPYEIRYAERLVREWRETITSPKIFFSRDIRYRDIFYDKDEFDGFILEPETKFGVFYQYAPVDANLRYIFNLARDFKDLPEDAAAPGNTGFLSNRGQFFMALYYLKLYYGEHFNYALWRTGDDPEYPSLAEALENLALYAFAPDTDAAEYILVSHPEDEARRYMEYMFYTNIEEFLDTRNPYHIIDYCQRAAEIFPEDLWPLYWIAFVGVEQKNYAPALASFQKLFANPLSLNMEILPLAYTKASFCASRLGDEKLARLYAARAEALYAEYTVDLSAYAVLGCLF
jgi:hypothetical protein